LLFVGKKRKSSKTTKNSNDNDNNDVRLDNNNVDDNKLKEDEIMQNGHCHVDVESAEDGDVVSELPVYGLVHRHSLSKTTTNNSGNGFY